MGTGMFGRGRMSAAPRHVWAAHHYVAWFSVSNFVTAGLLPYVMPFDQGVMQRSFDAGLYVMRLMHGSSTAVTYHSVAAPGEGAAAGVGAASVGPRPR